MSWDVLIGNLFAALIVRSFFKYSGLEESLRRKLEKNKGDLGIGYAKGIFLVIAGYMAIIFLVCTFYKSR